MRPVTLSERLSYPREGPREPRMANLMPKPERVLQKADDSSVAWRDASWSQLRESAHDSTELRVACSDHWKG